MGQNFRPRRHGHFTRAPFAEGGGHSLHHHYRPRTPEAGTSFTKFMAWWAPILSCPAEKVIREAKVLLIDQYGTRGNLRATKIARSFGLPVVADFEDEAVPHFKEVLGLVDHLILSEEFSSQITSQANAADAAVALWRPSARRLLSLAKKMVAGACPESREKKRDIMKPSGCRQPTPTAVGMYFTALMPSGWLAAMRWKTTSVSPPRLRPSRRNKPRSQAG